MGTADPDAIWKPGFTGEIVYPSREPAGATGSGRRGRILALGALLLVAAGAVGAVALGRGDPPADPAAVLLPESPSLRWNVELPGGGVHAVGGSARDLVVVADERNRQVIALDAASGEERWRAAVPDGSVVQLVVVGDVVVVVLAGDPAIVAYDAEGGDRRWQRPAQDGGSFLPTGRLTLLDVQGDRRDDGLAILDPASGDVIDAVDGFVGLHRRSFERQRSSVLTVHDLRTLDPIGRVDLDDLGLDVGRAVAAVPADEGIAVAWEGGAALVADDGEVIGRVALSGPTSSVVGVSIEALDEDGRFLAVQQGDRLTVLTTAEGSLSELWADDAMLLDWQATPDGRAVLATSGVEGSIVSMPSQLVDVETGQALGRGPEFSAGWPFRMFASDGFVDVSPSAESSLVVGYDLARRERWRLTASRGAVQPVDGGLLVLDASSPSATVLHLYA